MNANAAIDMLVHEHKVILKVVDGLRRLAEHIRKGRRAEIMYLQEAVIFMREFADKCHHAKEEDLLFPALVAHGVPLHGCPIDALLHEHERGRHLVKEISDALGPYAAGAMETENVIADAIDGIVKLYPNHIWKEDDMVFPMVERLFTETERSELYRQFENVESNNPPGTHNHFHEFAERLANHVAEKL